jgi:hypothetical protein
MQFRFQPEAEIELAEARLWYSLQRQGLDAALMRRVDQTLAAMPRILSHIRLSIEIFDAQ